MHRLATVIPTQTYTTAGSLREPVACTLYNNYVRNTAFIRG